MGKNLKKELESKRLKFRAFCDEDAISIFEYASDEETVKYLSWSAHTTVEQSLDSIRNFLKREGAYAIIIKETNKLVGCIDIRIEEDKKATFGYVLNKKYWNKGYMSEALNFFINYLFTEMDIEEVYGVRERENIASGKVMLKCNMKWECLKKNENINNKIADYDHYSIKKATK